jgi:hypothetical protein
VSSGRHRFQRRIEADIVGGDGDPSFRCSSGHVAFDGLDPVVTGLGGYRGTWTHGCRRA